MQWLSGPYCRSGYWIICHPDDLCPGLYGSQICRCMLSDLPEYPHIDLSDNCAWSTDAHGDSLSAPVCARLSHECPESKSCSLLFGLYTAICGPDAKFSLKSGPYLWTHWYGDVPGLVERHCGNRWFGTAMACTSTCFLARTAVVYRGNSAFSRHPLASDGIHL